MLKCIGYAINKVKKNVISLKYEFRQYSLVGASCWQHNAHFENPVCFTILGVTFGLSAFIRFKCVVGFR